MAYFRMLKEIVGKRGIPQALYHDRGSVFVSAQSEQEEGIDRPGEGQSDAIRPVVDRIGYYLQDILFATVTGPNRTVLGDMPGPVGE